MMEMVGKVRSRAGGMVDQGGHVQVEINCKSAIFRGPFPTLKY